MVSNRIGARRGGRMGNRIKPRPWCSEYEIGHAMIDADHHKLVELANRVGEVLNDGDAKYAVGLMQHFVEVAREHFNKEEELMRDIRFRQIDAHVRYHKLLLSSAANVMTQCEAGSDIDLIRDSFEVLANCLLDDVISGDRELRSVLPA